MIKKAFSAIFQSRQTHNLVSVAEWMYRFMISEGQDNFFKGAIVERDLIPFEGKINSHFDDFPDSEFEYEMEYYERGSAGIKHCATLRFTINDCEFTLTNESPSISVTINLPPSHLPLLESFFQQNNEWPAPEKNLTPKSLEQTTTPIAFNAKLGYQVFELIQHSIHDFIEAFELKNNTESGFKSILKTNQKEVVKYAPNKLEFEVTYWTNIQKEFDRNYVGVILKVNQGINESLPEKFDIIFHHNNRHELGQNDFTVNRCYMTYYGSESPAKSYVLNLRTWLMLNGLL